MKKAGASRLFSFACRNLFAGGSHVCQRIYNDARALIEFGLIEKTAECKLTAPYAGCLEWLWWGRWGIRTQHDYA